jgi:ABC-2 type transport system ATP-binding protein
MNWGLTNVSVDFDGITALDQVSLPLEPGTVTAVVGGDGAGKSTLARVVVGLITPDEGAVRRPNRYGFQPSTSGTWADMTVIENLQFVATAFGLNDSERRSRIERLLHATQLKEAAGRLAGRLSGGMRQKLGVAMALLPEPALIVLDEPTTGLDPVSRLEITAFIASAAATGTAVLLTTTYVDESSRASYVLALDEGRVLAHGKPKDVLATVPGAMFTANARRSEYSWRRGRMWRMWSPDGTAPPDGERVAADLDDVITIAAFRREAGW